MGAWAGHTVDALPTGPSTGTVLAMVVGWVTTALIVLMVATGVWLEFFYTPEAARAWDDIESLQNEIAWGLWVRNQREYLRVLIAIATVIWLALLIGSRGEPRRIVPVVLLTGLVAVAVIGLERFYGEVRSYAHLLLWTITCCVAVAGVVASHRSGYREAARLR